MSSLYVKGGVAKMSGDYYSPPYEWQFDSMVQMYRSLTSNKIDLEVDFEYFEKFEGIVKVKQLLLFISDRIKLNDSAAISISVNFVISPVFFHYSGYIRQSMARRLKNADLSANQISQIIKGVESLIKLGKTGQEFKQIHMLYLRVKAI